MNDFYKPNDAAALPSAFGYFEDFIFAGSVTTANTFIVTAVASGTFATSAANGGWGVIANNGTDDNSGANIQMAGAHACTAYKPMVFKTRLKTNEATQSDIWAGLLPIDTDFNSGFPDNAIYFVKADGATTMACVVRAATVDDSTTLTAAQFTCAANTVYRLGIGVFPTGTAVGDVEFSIDDVVVCRKVGVTLPSASIYLTPSIEALSGSAAAYTCTIDYISGYQAR